MPKNWYSMPFGGFIVCYLLRFVVVIFALCLVPACIPVVEITSTRTGQKIGSIEPVMFVVFESRAGYDKAAALQRYIYLELKRKKIQGSARVIAAADFNEEALLEEMAAESNCVVLVLPAGGTTHYGILVNVNYDVRAFEIMGPKKSRSIWRGRLDNEIGISDSQHEEFAKVLISKLIKDRILPRRVAESE